MTNGEKIQTILDVDRDCTEVHGDNGTMTFTVTLDFWNAEYKEPNKSEIPTGSNTKDDLALIHTWGLDEEIRCAMCTNSMKSNRGCDGSCVVNKDMYNAVMDAIEKRIQSTTKNDLGVELIDRAELLKAMDTWDKFGYTARYGLERLDKDDKDFVPYVKYDDMVNCVKNMPPVTPIRPKGHWQVKDTYPQECECWDCSECQETVFEKSNFCPNCGADMREVEE